MTTAYTDILINNPNTTFTAFALRCARAFGACVELHDVSLDAPPPDEVKPDTWLQERLEEAETELAAWEAMSLSDAESVCTREYRESCAHREEWRRRVERENATIYAMLAKVETWNPPSEEHRELKKFMMEQLRMSIRQPPSKPPRQPTAEWLADRIRYAADTVKWRHETWAKEQARAVRATKWLRELRASLDNA